MAKSHNSKAVQNYKLACPGSRPRQAVLRPVSDTHNKTNILIKYPPRYESDANVMSKLKVQSEVEWVIRSELML